MSLNASAILTLNQAKIYMKKTDSNNDSIVESFINAASDYIESIIGNKVIAQDVLDVLDGSGGDSLFPSFFPVVDLVGTSVQERLDNFQCRGAYNEQWQNLFSALNQFTVINNPAYKNYHQHWRRLDGYNFPDGIQNIRIFYRAGFVTIPSQFIQCCSEMVEMLWKESPYGNSDLGKSSVTESSQGQNSTTQLKAMDKRWVELIGEYIREELK
jgi:hypothetical protein